MKEVLLTSSILILLIAALRPILRGRTDPRMQYALWLIVALRLLVPVNFAASAYSALALLDRAGEPSRIVETIGQTAIPARSYDSARAQVIEDYHQRGVADHALTPGDLMDIDAQARELMKGPTLSELAEKYARPVWLSGAALMAAWFAFVNLRLRRKLKDAVPVEADCPLPVYRSDALPSPCLRGTFRPAVYATPAVLESPDRLRHVLAHELTHYRHRDHWWALLRCLCICLYWFDPLVWWAAALSRQDCELACDEGTIRTLGEGERIPYGRTLVAMIAAGRDPLLQTATTMTGGKRRVRERVALIARGPKPMIAVALALAVILACAVGCTFTGAPEGDPDPTASQKPGPVASDALTADTPRERLLDTQTVLETEGAESLNTPPKAMDGVDRTLCITPDMAPSDPETWYLVGQVPGEPIWMFSRNHGEETRFQTEDHMQDIVYPRRAHASAGHAGMPQLRQLDAPDERNGYGTVAAITHQFQGGTDQQYQLVVYDLEPDTGPKDYAHDWETLMLDLNENCDARLDPIDHTGRVTYQGQSFEVQLDEAGWENASQYGFSGEVYEYAMRYSFNDDGTFNLEMPVTVSSFTTPYTAVWTIRFTGSGFETTGFQFIEAPSGWFG